MMKTNSVDNTGLDFLNLNFPQKCSRRHNIVILFILCLFVKRAAIHNSTLETPKVSNTTILKKNAAEAAGAHPS